MTASHFAIYLFKSVALTNLSTPAVKETNPHFCALPQAVTLLPACALHHPIHARVNNA